LLMKIASAPFDRQIMTNRNDETSSLCSSSMIYWLMKSTSRVVSCSNDGLAGDDG
jgi:hypothetical protein